MRSRYFFSLLFCFISALYFFGSTGCANIVPPLGGPRDTIPPTLINASPRDSSTNFRGNRVVLTFDEYIDLKDVPSNLLFTPTFERNPTVTAKAKTITVAFRDSLEANTTYTLNFGNAITDVNESNVLHNYSYSFSTGPVLDSLEFSGNVLLAETGKIDTTLQVLLHRNLSDTAVRTQRPMYISRLDGRGNFHFKNLPAGSFAIYALGDAGFTRRYQNVNQLFAFSDSTISPGKTKNITLYAYRAAATTPVPRSTTPVNKVTGGAERRLTFTTNLSGNQQNLLNDLILTFPTPLKTFDSSLVSLSTDSAYNRERFNYSFDSSRKELRIKTAWKEGRLYNVILKKDFAEDTAGRKLLKADTLHFTTKKLADYGELIVRVKNITATRNPVLQFVQSDRVVFSTSIKTGIFTEKMFTPGDYQLRILYDTNGNGKWDPGEFSVRKRQPELVFPIERTITVKANLENDFEVSL